MKVLITVALMLFGCSRPAPDVHVTTFGSYRDIDNWFIDKCGRGLLRSATVMDNSRIEGTYFSAYRECDQILSIEDATVEIRSDGHEVCGIRIGPSKLTQRLDPNFVLPWFRDQALAERVATQLATEEASVVDGLFVGMIQDKSLSTRFMLVIDGCGHRSEAGRGPISMY